MQLLRELQRDFMRALLDPSAMRGHETGEWVPGIRSDGISPAVRLGFYRTNVFENYRNALRLAYPVVERLVGLGFFRHLADEYLRRYPSCSGDVGEHGSRFAEFLRKHPCADELPYLADVARLEWCIEESFNEADHEPLPVARLRELPVEQCESLRFVVAPCCRLLSSSFPIQRIWELCQPGYQGEIEIDLTGGGVDLLVRRDGYAVTVEVLAAAELAMLVALDSGYTFAEALHYASAVGEGFDPAAFLRRHVLSGTLADFKVSPEALQPVTAATSKTSPDGVARTVRGADARGSL